ncbi:MAG: alpha/beta fold hydrolase [Candidatus Sericytochromatia bacterium]|nr:alpha/beta fold hydrolase [Candidatus Tanganyikabacteria bacterium]
MADNPRWLYLHGFGSGPDSAKGVYLARRFAALGVTLERLNLRVPSLERLLLSAMIETAGAAIGGGDDSAVVFGSSLGGLAACRLAERDARVSALVLLAPAFQFAARWRERPEFEAWRQAGWIDAYDHARGCEARIHFAFAEDALAVDAPGGGWPDVRVPVLIVHGVRDEVVEVERSRAWAAGKRHVRLIEVDDAHDLLASLPLIAREAEAFLAPWLGKPC